MKNNIKGLALASPLLLVFLPKEGIQQFFMLITLFGNVVAVVHGEVEEVTFGDDILAVGF